MRMAARSDGHNEEAEVADGTHENRRFHGSVGLHGLQGMVVGHETLT